LLVAHVVRFFPEYAQAKAIVDRGEIGRVGVVRLRRVSALPTWSEDNWLMDEEKSGGMILDLMVHDFDYARWVAGEVESVFARNVRRALPDEQRDYALVILRHTSGALSHVEGGWAYPAGMFRTALEIAGSGGLIEHPSGSSVPIQIHLMETEEAKATSVPTSPLIEDPYVTEIKHFYDAIANHATPRVTAADGLAALRIGLAAIKSARTGQRVTL
jgi:predicted dehydrogenase